MHMESHKCTVVFCIWICVCVVLVYNLTWNCTKPLHVPVGGSSDSTHKQIMRVGLVISVDQEHETRMDNTSHTPRDSSRLYHCVCKCRPKRILLHHYLYVQTVMFKLILVLFFLCSYKKPHEVLFVHLFSSSVLSWTVNTYDFSWLAQLHNWL